MNMKKAPRSLFARTDRSAQTPKAEESPRKTAPPQRTAKNAASSANRSSAAQSTTNEPKPSRQTAAPVARPVIDRPVSSQAAREQPPAPQPRNEPTKSVSVSTKQAPVASLPQRQSSLNISHLRDTFESQIPNRRDWSATDYSELILRLDRLQTEAFILKGKLLSEAKRKFFETNKQGWADFCGVNLGMNYTTANQYIRVALEFDVTSHQFPQLSFEHFKALLPVPPAERMDVLKSFEGTSVKALRTAVQSFVQKGEGTRHPDRSLQNARQMLKVLQNVHTIMSTTDTSALSQQLRWQLSAACSQVASQLLQFSNRTNEAFIQEEVARPTHQIGASGFDSIQK